jgi:hypothetical protein
MQPLPNNEQALQSVQVLLTVLSDEGISTPNNLLEAVVSGKSILRALLQGQVVLCTPGAPDKLAGEKGEGKIEDETPSEK